MAQQRPQSAFFQDAFGSSMFDGFDNPMDEFLNGGMMPGFSQRRQSHQQPRSANEMFSALFSGMDGGNFFQGFPG